MMGTGDKVLLLTGESYFETSEDDAVQFCESEVEKLQQKVEDLKEVEESIITEQTELKSILYGRFGKSINLEE
jgi:chaperonin cofactor prefoldin